MSVDGTVNPDMSTSASVRRTRVRGVAAVVVAVAWLAFASVAAAGTVTLGPKLPTNPIPTSNPECEANIDCGQFNVYGANFDSLAPADGTITSWSVESFAGSAELIVVQNEGSSGYKIVQEGPVVTEPCVISPGNSNNCIANPGVVYTFSSNVPIQAGQYIGVRLMSSPNCSSDVPEDCSAIGSVPVGDSDDASASTEVWASTPSVGTATQPSNEYNLIPVALNAVEQTVDGIEISAGNAIPEPASGSSNPATFTIALPSAQSVATTVDYQTVDGSATVKAGNYTAVTNGSVTIPAGQSSAQVQVQVDAGNGTATTSSIGFQVQVTGFTGGDPGLTVDPAGASAPGTISIPGIGGTVTGAGGAVTPGVTMVLTGTASTGQSVRQTTTTDAKGMYQLYADPGTYTLTPTPPAKAAGNPTYSAVNCPGTSVAGGCTNISLTSGPSLVANFKEVSLIVNSTDTTVNSSEAMLGVCDVTPTQAQATCTLPQAVAVSNDTGGQTIGFDLPGTGVPVITLDTVYGGQTPEIMLTAPTVIDGTTQPGSGRVDLVPPFEAPASYGIVVSSGAAGSTIRGMVIAGFGQDQIALESNSNVVQDDYLGTNPAGTAPGQQRVNALGGVLVDGATNQIGGASPGQGNLISGNEYTGPSPGGGMGAGPGAAITLQGGGRNVIQGNTIGPPLGGTVGMASINLSGFQLQPQPYAIVERAASGHNTIGGTTAAAGNVTAGDVTLAGSADTFAGNRIYENTTVEVDGNDTIGGATGSPGTPPGNEFETARLLVDGPGAVVQGNLIDGGQVGVLGDGNTIGGDRPALGNRFVHYRESDYGCAAVGLGTPHTSLPDAVLANDNVIEGNQIIGDSSNFDQACGAVGVWNGAGNRITDNRLTNDFNGILLGPGGYFYDGSQYVGHGANISQPYPQLLDVKRSSGTELVGRLDAQRRRSYTIDLYSQPSCAMDSVTPGVGARLLGSQTIKTDGFGQVSFDLHFSVPTSPAVTATSTGPDGSTSEFSPCLTMGTSAPAFVKSGVTVPGGVSAGGSSGTARDDSLFARLVAPVAVAASVRTKAVPTTATIHPFCPPLTTGSCTGKLRVTTVGRGRLTLVARKFKLAPGELIAIDFRIPATVRKLLRREHRIRVRVTITAHDGAGHTRTTATVVTFAAA